MIRQLFVFLSLLALAPLCFGAGRKICVENSKSAQPRVGRTIDFANDIAPILRTRCIRCHGDKKPRSGLRLTTRAQALHGGDSGKIIQVGRSSQSRLVHLISGTSKDKLVMPPKGKRLSPRQIKLLRHWIDQGAPWPKKLILTADQTMEKNKNHWAFKPIRRPIPSKVQRFGWTRNPIDRFILRRLEKELISPAAEADPETLIRRVTLDLIGLPPTPKEIADFVGDNRPGAYERLLDRLLASPHYGEKWAQPWLDLCHFADTDGYLTDQLRPVAWRYRQWLVDALNRDMPFDQFTIGQLAGDLLPDSTIEQKIATGFLRNTLSNREGGADLEQFRVEQIVDRTMMTGTTWLGLTVGCARCHDHKYDPISQKEFFQLYAFFDSADEVNIDAPLPGELKPHLAKRPDYDRKRAAFLKPLQKQISELQRRWEKKLLWAAGNPGKNHVWDRQWEVLGLVWGGNLGEGQLEGTQIVMLDPAKRTQDQKDRLLDYFLRSGSLIATKRFNDLKLSDLRSKLEMLKPQLPKVTRAPTVRETKNSRSAYIHMRGDFRRKGKIVKPATPAVLPPIDKNLKRNRLALAKWLMSPHNPLTSRVVVNRFWQEFFGKGLVLTSEDFGTRGERPSHPELLDWLAAEFRDGGWGMKRIHRLIVTSATYRQSSRYRKELATRDPNNRLLARQAKLRLSADQIRDSALAVSGLLHRRIGGPSVFPPQPKFVAKEGFDNKWTPSKGADRYRRGLYTFLHRLSPFAQKVTFDAPPLSKTCSRRDRSNTPLQALSLLNDPVYFEAAQGLAARTLCGEKRGFSDRMDYAFRLCLGRSPSDREMARLRAYYQDQLAIFQKNPNDAKQVFPNSVNNATAAEAAACTGVCSVLLNLHEFITRP